jgi:hypothetical protein
MTALVIHLSIFVPLGCLKTLSVSKSVQRRSIVVAGLLLADGPVMAVDDITELRYITFTHILKLNVETEM